MERFSMALKAERIDRVRSDHRSLARWNQLDRIEGRHLRQRLHAALSCLAPFNEKTIFGRYDLAVRGHGQGQLRESLHEMKKACGRRPQAC
jgi:hypothetical protein